MFFVEAGAENPLAAGCVSAAISMLYLESADAAIPVGAFAGYAVCSWLRYLFGGSGGIMELMERLCECVEDVLTI
ncbi:hypothetical protein [Emergencia timonensis]